MKLHAGRNHFIQIGIHFMIVIGMAQVSAASVYYVDAAKGNDVSNSGLSLTLPFRTILKGVKMLKPGDTLYVRAGTYLESLNNVIPSGASEGRPVTVAAYSGEEVIIRPNSGSERVVYFGQTTTQFIILDGLILDGTNVGYDVIKIANGAKRITIMNCEIKHSANGHGVLLSGEGSDYNKIINCKIHDNGKDSYDHQIYVKTGYNLIEGNELYNGHGYGIHQYSGTPTRNVYRRNRIHHTNEGILLSSGSNNTADHNLLYQNGIDIAVQYRETGSAVYNNTCYASRGGIVVYPDAVKTVVKNNISFKHSVYNYKGDGSADTVVSNNLFSGDPLFMDAPHLDFHLRANSPAIDMGTNVGSSDDIDSHPIKGNAPDMGAFEYQGSPTSLLPVPQNVRVVNR